MDPVREKWKKYRDKVLARGAVGKPLRQVLHLDYKKC
jgi:hypothetical protein